MHLDLRIDDVTANSDGKINFVSWYEKGDEGDSEEDKDGD